MQVMFRCMSPVSRLPARVWSSFRRFRVPWPVLTAAEKTALLALTLVLSTGGLLRVWERAGVSIGPVDDWDGLRALVIRSRDRLDRGSGTGREGGGYPCLDDAPVLRAGGPGGGGGAGISGTEARFAPGRMDADAGMTGKSKAGGGKSAGKAAPSRPLDLNAVSERALLALPGVGPATAKAIVAWRTAHGRFQSVDDLLQVKGIGPKKLETLRPYVTVERKDEPKGGGPSLAGSPGASGASGASGMKSSPDGRKPDPGSGGDSPPASSLSPTPVPPAPP